MKTYQPKLNEITRQWHVIDAKDQILGRLATRVATILMGKNKPTFSNHMDCGDYVVITNAAQIKVTGAKETDKMYYSHSGQPRGFKAIAYKDLMTKDPTKIFTKAVKGMLPKNKLQADRLKRLKIFVDDKHPYQDKLIQKSK
jgi:large subunit ribosomal protein L13